MKGLKKRKGVTLVEVLISLVLIGVITAGLLTFFAGSFDNILRQRKQNTTNFDIQESFETQLADIKKNSGKGTEVETFTYRVGTGNSQSVNVTGQTLSYKEIFIFLLLTKKKAYCQFQTIYKFKFLIPSGTIMLVKQLPVE